MGVAAEIIVICGQHGYALRGASAAKFSAYYFAANKLFYRNRSRNENVQISRTAVCNKFAACVISKMRSKCPENRTLKTDARSAIKGGRATG